MGGVVMFGLRLYWPLGLGVAVALSWATAGPAPAAGPGGAHALALVGPPGEKLEELGESPDEARLGPEGVTAPGEPGLGPEEEPLPRFFEPRPEDRERVRRFLEEHFPRMAQELRRLEQRNPRMVRRRLREMMPRIIRLMHELEKDEELGLLGVEEERLEFQIQQGVRLYLETAHSQEREAAKAKVEQLIAEQFDVRQQRAQRTIEHLEHRLQRLKRHLERRAREREEVIAQEIELRLNPDAPPGPRPRRGLEDRPPARRPPRGDQRR
jgi:hypothetical protein